MIIQPPDEIAIEQQSTLPMVLEQEEVEQRPATPIAVEEPVEQGREPTQAAPEEVAEQPTQAIDMLQDKTEQQPTRIVVAVRYRADRKRRQAIATGQLSIAEQTTQLMAVVQQTRRALSEPRWRWIVPVLMCLVISGGVMGGVAALHVRVPIFTAIHKILIPSTRVHNPRNALSRANDVAAQFMDAMMHKDWTSMWSMLAPDAQKSWQGQKDFIQFEKAKFGALKFISFKASTAGVQQSWLDPDTTQI